MPSVKDLLRAHETGNRSSLQALGVALAAELAPVPDRPTDPVELLQLIEDTDAEAAGTWDEVRAAHDYGRLTDAEYVYLHAAVGSLTLEESS